MLKKIITMNNGIVLPKKKKKQSDWSGCRLPPIPEAWWAFRIVVIVPLKLHTFSGMWKQSSALARDLDHIVKSNPAD